MKLLVTSFLTLFILSAYVPNHTYATSIDLRKKKQSSKLNSQIQQHTHINQHKATPTTSNDAIAKTDATEKASKPIIELTNDPASPPISVANDPRADALKITNKALSHPEKLSSSKIRAMMKQRKQFTQEMVNGTPDPSSDVKFEQTIDGVDRIGAGFDASDGTLKLPTLVWKKYTNDECGKYSKRCRSKNVVCTDR